MVSRLKAELKRRVESFRFAFAGWEHVLRTQPNTWIHSAISVAAVFLAFWLRLPPREWAVLILTMVVVWVAEFTNTAIEAVVDMAMPDPHPLAKVAKDVAAAAVLISALGAILIGLLVLGPPLWQRLTG